MTAMLCGICGGSGAGKTTLTRLLVAELGADEAVVLSFDAYYRDLPGLERAERRLRNYDHPDSLEHELLARHLDDLRLGSTVDIPEYDFSIDARTGRHSPVEPRPTVVVEGILLLAFPDIAERLDLTVFLDVPEPIRLARRIRRDVTERGRDADDVRRQFTTTVAPMHDRFVQPSRVRADRVVTWGEPMETVALELARRISSSRVA